MEKNTNEGETDMSSAFEIACTGCAFCSDRCPMDIPIPQYFMIYNEAMKASRPREGHWNRLRIGGG